MEFRSKEWNAVATVGDIPGANMQNATTRYVRHRNHAAHRVYVSQTLEVYRCFHRQVVSRENSWKRCWIRIGSASCIFDADPEGFFCAFSKTFGVG